MTFSLKRTTSTDPDFVKLVGYLNAELSKVNGNEDAFYAQFNKIDQINHVVLVCDNNKPIACGAIKQFSSAAMEVKRMFTLPNNRGQGAASILLEELERWAKEMGYEKCVLETSKRQPDALALYSKNGYEVIPNYGQYIGIANSICFEKTI
ncbi:GNAT family N-acetyltransferase [Pedobacter sp. SL55]|uniref:GNAT family N-acetyltransferase n=1 Tax=Pedobacter sp. SL55 TaxID=2995161 RepID=UPI002271E926|nr:GNAT family N-acetyltransferase [Pedobacter sp. SL55]WAC41379.1 GNAT family N-acetyltransferase [Pedobacter sp. SL55]